MHSFSQVPCPCIFDPAEKYLSLVIPAFNEEHRLPGALDVTMNYLLKRAAKDESFSYEVVIVDDGSSDGTKKVAFDFVKKYGIDNVRVILLSENHGKGEATRNGMLHSRGELLLMLDADGATKVTDLEKLENQICAIVRKEYSTRDPAATDTNFRVSDVPVVAFGSRAHLEEKALAKRKRYRNFLMKGFHFVVLLTAGPGVCDTQCGFKMFTRSAARMLFTNIRLKRWCFDVELVYLCKWFGIQMLETSINWSEIPGSKDPSSNDREVMEADTPGLVYKYKYLKIEYTDSLKLKSCLIRYRVPTLTAFLVPDNMYAAIPLIYTCIYANQKYNNLSEVAEASQDRASDPNTVLPFGWSNNLDLHAARSEHRDLLTHSISDTEEHRVPPQGQSYHTNLS
ncbi:hypothetical protein V6N12_045373 [Hibiscus sabdariffa]|uniref:dolichyl-phosphate beta-glucosyltransferase n=1 Tax=Hibiscus sabdariffa TaxID=183260 RepID=A0ABR2G3A7_9ROSI